MKRSLLHCCAGPAQGGSCGRGKQAPFSDPPCAGLTGAAHFFHARVAGGRDRGAPFGQCSVGSFVESVVAPGMNVMKTFEPPLEELVGRKVAGVRRVGKMPVVEFGDLALLIHLMSAGRLRMFDKRATPKDRASRVLVRLEDGRELRLREFGTKQRAWAKLLPVDAVADDEMVASLGPEAWPPPPLDEFATAIDKPRHLHPLLRHQKDIAGIGRSWVDEILWEAGLSPVQERHRTDRGGGRAATQRSACSWRCHRALRADDRTRGPRQSPDAPAGTQARGPTLPALRNHHRGGLLLGTPNELLPQGANRRPRPQRSSPVETAQVGRRGGPGGASPLLLRRDLPRLPPGTALSRL